MKNLQITLLVLLLAANTSYSQWIAQNSGTNQNLYDVEFINENTGWAVGDAGVVIKTTNGGKEWFNVPNPSLTVSGNLWSVFPLDSNVVYVTSGSDLIMRTLNGGTNWDILKSRPPGGGTAYKDVFFLNHDTGWFLNTTHVLRTYDGFITYDSIPIPTFAAHAIYFKDATTGIYSGDGVVFKSTDGGDTWFDTNIPPGPFYMFRKLAVVGDNVWVSGDHVIFKSTDFCETWETIEFTDMPGGWALYFVNQDTGFIGSGLNKVFKTSNGGYNWHQQVTDSITLAFISSMTFVNDTVGWYVGGIGKVFHTTNGGEAVTSIINHTNILPDKFFLSQNYPNPFNSQTTIEFSINQSSFYTLEIFNLLGQKVEEIFSRYIQPGSYSITYNADKLSSGVYIYMLSSDKVSLQKKFVLMK